MEVGGARFDQPGNGPAITNPRRQLPTGRRHGALRGAPYSHALWRKMTQYGPPDMRHVTRTRPVRASRRGGGSRPPSPLQRPRIGATEGAPAGPGGPLSWPGAFQPEPDPPGRVAPPRRRGLSDARLGGAAGSAGTPLELYGGAGVGTQLVWENIAIFSSDPPPIAATAAPPPQTHFKTLRRVLARPAFFFPSI